MAAKKKQHNKTDVVLVDHPEKDSDDFKRGLVDSTAGEGGGGCWQVESCVANKGRDKRFSSVARYFKYFAFPFAVFLRRNRYRIIVGWQTFYGLNLAFYERLFHVRKSHVIIVCNLAYKKKSGFIGKMYDKYMRYVVNSEYVDLIISSSSPYCEIIKEEFSLDNEKVIAVPFGIEDYAKMSVKDRANGDFILSVGRSNRDWGLLIECFRDTPYTLKIVCDTYHPDNLPQNIEVLNTVHGDETHRLMADCKCAIISIADPKLSSGETVLLKQFCFGKPVIVTAPSTLADDYIVDGYNGLIVSKDRKSIIGSIETLYSSDELYNQLCSGARNSFEQKYSLYAYGQNIGRCLSHWVSP
jgi:glycosyltransferase involved in cell wall biosynthesis